MRLKVQVNNNNVVKELCARGRGIDPGMSRRGGVHFLRGRGLQVTENMHFYF